jgi:hypothetical protein
MASLTFLFLALPVFGEGWVGNHRLGVLERAR